MRFFAILTLINVACFLPLYLLNAREAPNPFRLLRTQVKTTWTWPLRLAYFRDRSPDPFRVHFDFTFVALLIVAVGAGGSTVELVATAVLAIGFVEILYTSVMHSIFKRPAALTSDVALLKSGIALAQRQVYWMSAVVLAALIAIWMASAQATAALFGATLPRPRVALVTAALLLPPCLYRFYRYYTAYLWRTVYSPTLHFVLNLRVEASMRRVAQRDAAYYAGFNRFRDVDLSESPNVVVIAIESYGSIVYRDPRFGGGISELIGSMETELADRGYGFASTFSEAPLFAGGSWLSYATFLYGARIDNLQLYDNLFSRPNSFGSYESLFHILRRSGYENLLLCPLGGVDSHTVDWESLDRCFQAQQKIRFEDLGYAGPRINFFGGIRRYAPLDQFSLNYGYELGRSRPGPFSLFFCTLNSHYPWHSVTEAADDWRALESSDQAPMAEARPQRERYTGAIRYQLDYILRFVRDRADEAPLIILFGDHQPPMITPESMGPETPVHVISKDQALLDTFLANGFTESIDLTGVEPKGIRHEGFLSLVAAGLQAAYGTRAGLDLPYQEEGSRVFEEASSGALPRAG